MRRKLRQLTAELNRVRQRLSEIEDERLSLLAKKRQLELELKVESDSYNQCENTDDTLITTTSSPGKKVAFFRDLFYGREDVYARRWESLKSGKSGYQPACAHEWLAGVCDKPTVKCGECPNRQLLPLTDR